MVDEGIKLIAQNRRARYDYFILEAFEAGLVLTGTEVKSLRAGRASLAESYARVENGEAILVGAHFPEYSHGNRTNHEPTRARKLLLHKREIEQLREGLEQKGLTIVPLKLYWKNGRAKIEIALARGKKQHDRREDTAKREAQREMDRAARRMREA
ncbi:MAG TPA: SsrA-binding protein SmpB [bacterium]|nr:SsrA-binding protein SmpB [bacterium]